MAGIDTTTTTTATTSSSSSSITSTIITKHQDLIRQALYYCL
jgi:hypothetical protein